MIEAINSTLRNNTCQEINFLIFSLDVFTPGRSSGGNLMIDNVQVQKLSAPVNIEYEINDANMGTLTDCANDPCNGIQDFGQNGRYFDSNDCCKLMVYEACKLEFHAPSNLEYCTFTWTHNGNFVANTQTLSFQSINLTDAGKYLLEIVDESGCRLYKCIDLDIEQCITVETYISNEFCGQNNAYVEFDIVGKGGTYTYTFDGPGISPITSSCTISANGGTCSFISPQNLPSGKYEIFIHLDSNPSCTYYEEICIIDIDQTIVDETGNGINAGFVNHQGVSLNSGTEIEWRFEPFNVADRMEITLNGNLIVNTGSVTLCSSTECTNGNCFKMYRM